MTNWIPVKSDLDVYGRTAELRSMTFGKGSGRRTSWRMYCDGTQVGYASTIGDAEVNFARVLAGYRRDVETGRWVANPPGHRS